MWVRVCRAEERQTKSSMYCFVQLPVLNALNARAVASTACPSLTAPPSPTHLDELLKNPGLMCADDNVRPGQVGLELLCFTRQFEEVCPVRAVIGKTLEDVGLALQGLFCGRGGAEWLGMLGIWVSGRHTKHDCKAFSDK